MEARGDSVVTRKGSAALPWLILALAAAFNLTNALVAASDPYIQFRVGDEGFYDAWGRQIASGQLGLDKPFFTTPLFAYWLGGLYALGLDSIRHVLVANAVLGTVAVLSVFFAARRLAGTPVAVAAAAFIALSRATLVYETSPDKSTLVLCLAAVAVAAVAWAYDERRVGGWVLAGLATGLAGLAHVLTLVLVPVGS